MIHHIVWWDLKAEAEGRTAAENAALMKARGETMMGKIPSLLSLELSHTFLTGTTVPVGILLHSTHADEQGLKDYAGHPVHVEFGKLVGTVCENRRALDFVV